MSDTAPVAAPAAPAAAPAAAAASAPSTPTATPVAAPAAEPVSTPAAAPAADSSAAAPVAAEAPAAATDAPKRSDFPEDGDGIEAFLKARNAWEEEHPDGTQFVTGDEVPVEADPNAPPEVKAAEEEVKAEDEAKAADEPKDEPKEAEVEAPTPEGLSKLLEANPDLKAAIEAAPEAKGALYAMARQNAKAAPILEIFPNAESAKFAATNANEFVSLKTAFQLSDSPEKMADAAGMFLEQFKVVDDKGAPVLDAKGNPTYGDDLQLFTDHIKSVDRGVRIDDLKSRIAANAYTTPEGLDNDQQLLAAYEFIAAAESADPDALDKPDTSNLTPEQKVWQEREQAKIDAERERLGLKDKEMTKKQVVETRTKFDTKYREAFGGSTGKYLANYLKGKEEAGVAIPRYLLTMKDPQTGISVFAQQAFQKLNQKLSGMADVKAHSATLQMNAINDQALNARVEYGQTLIDEHLPGIIDDLLKEAGVALAEDSKKKIADRDAKRADARVEPAAGMPVSPRSMTPEQLMEQAKKNVAEKFPNVDDRTRVEKTLQEKNRLEAQR